MTSFEGFTDFFTGLIAVFLFELFLLAIAHQTCQSTGLTLEFLEFYFFLLLWTPSLLLRKVIYLKLWCLFSFCFIRNLFSLFFVSFTFNSVELSLSELSFTTFFDFNARTGCLESSLFVFRFLFLPNVHFKMKMKLFLSFHSTLDEMTQKPLA